LFFVFRGEQALPQGLLLLLQLQAKRLPLCTHHKTDAQGSARSGGEP
jgi:hypothetical protein